MSPLFPLFPPPRLTRQLRLRYISHLTALSSPSPRVQPDAFPISHSALHRIPSHQLPGRTTQIPTPTIQIPYGASPSQPLTPEAASPPGAAPPCNSRLEAKNACSNIHPQ